MTALDWSTTTTHTPVVCPPDPTAICAHCGRTLAQHVAKDLGIPDPATAVCLDRDAFTDHKAIRWLSFVLATGQSTDCEHASFCEQCGVAICPEHSAEFVACASNNALIHHWDCRADCTDCVDAIDNDARGAA